MAVYRDPCPTRVKRLRGPNLLAPPCTNTYSHIVFNYVNSSMSKSSTWPCFFETLHPLRLIASVEEIAILVDIGLIMTLNIHMCKKSRFGAQNVEQKSLLQ